MNVGYKFSKTFYVIIAFIIIPVILGLSDYSIVLKSRFYGEQTKVKVIKKSEYRRPVPCPESTKSNCSQNIYQLHVTQLVDGMTGQFVVETSNVGYYFIKENDEIVLYKDRFRSFSDPKIKMFLGSPEEEYFFMLLFALFALLFIISRSENNKNKRSYDKP